MNILHRASQNLLNQINDVLDFSKIEAERLKLEETPMLLYENIQNVLKIMELPCHEKNIQLESEIDFPKSLTLIGDPGRLEQILINLLGNAIKFTIEGNVSLSVRQREEKENKVTIDFSVKDTGIGIPADKIDKIFDSFFQARGSDDASFWGNRSWAFHL